MCCAKDLGSDDAIALLFIDMVQAVKIALVEGAVPKQYAGCSARFSFGVKQGTSRLQIVRKPEGCHCARVVSNWWREDCVRWAGALPPATSELPSSMLLQSRQTEMQFDPQIFCVVMTRTLRIQDPGTDGRSERRSTLNKESIGYGGALKEE